MNILKWLFEKVDGFKTYIASLLGMMASAADLIWSLYQNLTPAETGSLQAIVMDLLTHKPGSLLSLVFFVLTFLARLSAARPGPIGQALINRRIRDGLIDKAGA